MDKNAVKEAIKKLNETSKKRNFKQSYDLIVNLKGLDMKKPEQQVELYVPVHYSFGKKVKVCAFVDAEFKEEAIKVCDLAITPDEFPNYQKDKKMPKKLAEQYDVFIAQATIMPKLAQVFGKALGTRGKMPNPKAGGVIPPKAALKPLYERLQKQVTLRAKVQPIIRCIVGVEGQDEEEIADNVLTIYNALIHKLPSEEDNVRNILLKLTMSKPVGVK